MKARIILPLLLSLGCGTQPAPKNDALPVKKPVDNSARIAELEGKINELQKQYDAWDKWVEASVTARHPEWPHEEKKSYQLYILWGKGQHVIDYDKEEESMKDLEGWASRWYILGNIRVDLTHEDYRDQYKAGLAQWKIWQTMRAYQHEVTMLQDEMNNH